MGARRDGGETLIEILLTVVIVGLTFTALFSALAGAGNAGNAQRTSVQMDVVMRNFAEATKAAAQACLPGVGYRVPPPSVPPLPPGFLLSVSGSGVSPAAGVGTRSTIDLTCPTVGAPQLLTLKVAPGTGAAVTMQIKVNTP